MGGKGEVEDFAIVVSYLKLLEEVGPGLVCNTHASSVAGSGG